MTRNTSAVALPLFRGKAAARKSAIEEWVDSFTHLYAAVDEAMADLDVLLGEPRFEYGPAYVRGRCGEPARVRIGAMWVIDDVNTGFSVTFTGLAVELEAHHGARRITARTGITDRDTLGRDLRLAFSFVGLYQKAKV